MKTPANVIQTKNAALPTCTRPIQRQSSPAFPVASRPQVPTKLPATVMDAFRLCAGKALIFSLFLFVASCQKPEPECMYVKYYLDVYQNGKLHHTELSFDAGLLCGYRLEKIRSEPLTQSYCADSEDLVRIVLSTRP